MAANARLLAFVAATFSPSCLFIALVSSAALISLYSSSFSPYTLSTAYGGILALKDLMSKGGYDDSDSPRSIPLATWLYPFKALSCLMMSLLALSNSGTLVLLLITIPSFRVHDEDSLISSL